MAVIITSHAIERFVQRHATHLSYDEAREFLEEALPVAAPLKERTIMGQMQWQIDDPYCICVLKKDRRNKNLICVTVLPEPEGLVSYEDELELSEEEQRLLTMQSQVIRMRGRG